MPQYQFSRQTWTNLGSKTRFRDDRSATKASFTSSGFRAVDKFLFSPDVVVEHRKAYAYSHNPIIWPSGNLPAGCLEQPELSTAMTGRRTAAQSTVLQELLTDTFTHSGFNPAASERSASTAMSAEYWNSSVSQRWRYWFRQRTVNVSGGSQAGVVELDGWYFRDTNEKGMDRSLYLSSRRLWSCRCFKKNARRKYCHYFWKQLTEIHT
jgi:hypothetical protein